MNNTKSKEYFERAKKIIPSQSQTLSKAPTQFILGVHPYLIERGEGCYVWDVDGNKYIDLVGSLGAILLGYGHPIPAEAAKKVISEGSIYPLPHRLEIELGERLKKIISCAEMVKYGLNGSDATTGAIRVARAFTGKEHIAKCGYHGWQDWSISTNPGRSRGVPQAVKNLTHEFVYNDIASLQKIFDEFPNQVAAVILEPIAVTEPKNDFLKQVQKIAHGNNALLIFDEVVTGFRLALGGAQEYFGVKPDLAAFGKSLANGLPISFIAGREDIMRSFEDVSVFCSFTFGGWVPSLAASIATLDLLEKEPVIAHIWKMGAKLKDGINKLAAEKGLAITCNGLPPHNVVSFKDKDGKDDLIMKSLYLQETIKNGVLTNASHMIMYAHQEEHINQVLSAVDKAFTLIAKAQKEGDMLKYLEGPPVKPRARQQN